MNVPEKYRPTMEDVIALSDIDTMAPGRDLITIRMGEIANMNNKDILVTASHRGYQSIIYKKKFQAKSVVGLDIDPHMIESSNINAKANEMYDGIKFVLGDAQKMPFPDAQFDVVTNEGAVGIPDDPYKVLEEMVRVAKAGAMIIFRETYWKTNESAQERQRISYAYGSKPLTPDEWRESMEKAGMTNCHSELSIWDYPDIFWDVRHDRKVKNFDQLFTIGEKMRIAKIVMKKYGKMGIENASNNEYVFYNAVKERRLGYGIFWGYKM